MAIEGLVLKEVPDDVEDRAVVDGETHPYRLVAERLNQMRLADTRRTDEEQVLGVAEKTCR